MSLEVIRLYAEVSVALLLGWLLISLGWGLLRRFDAGARRWVALGYLLLLAGLVSPWLARLSSSASSAEMRPAIQVWSGTKDGAPRLDFVLTPDGSRPALQPWRASLHPNATRILSSILLATSALGLLRLLLRWRALRRRCFDLTTLRRRGRLRVVVSDENAAPFSARTGLHSFVVLPLTLLEDRSRLRLVLRHELQHIRHGDTLAVYLLELVRALLPWHPAAAGWCRLMEQLHEHACDQALLERGVSLSAYAECLIHVVQTTSHPRPRTAVAVGLGSDKRRHLRRRIEMLTNSSARRAAWVVPSSAIVGLALLAVVASAGAAAIADRRVTTAEVASIAVALAERGFTVPVDDTVVQQLNRMVGADEQRRHWRESLDRAELLRPRIDAILREHAVPTELASVALVESGFRDLPADPTDAKRRGAGVWQFIPETARHFGLRVDESVDERHDLERSTRAAARYLTELHTEFSDWPLAIAAYTHGAGRVRQLIAESKTRDAAALVRAGALSPYSSQVLAAMLLTERPQLLH